MKDVLPKLLQNFVKIRQKTQKLSQNKQRASFMPAYGLDIQVNQIKTVIYQKLDGCKKKTLVIYAKTASRKKKFLFCFFLLFYSVINLIFVLLKYYCVFKFLQIHFVVFFLLVDFRQVFNFRIYLHAFYEFDEI